MYNVTLCRQVIDKYAFYRSRLLTSLDKHKWMKSVKVEVKSVKV